MNTVPDNALCEICDSPATVEVRDTSTGTHHLYCQTHDRGDGNTHLEILRFRREPDSPASRLLAEQEESSAHQAFRAEMCDLQLLGREGACRYYLSRLTDSDQFSLWDNEFLDNVREYVVERTRGAAARFPFDLSTIECMAAFLKHDFETSRTGGDRKLSKPESAVVVLLHNPTWTDKQIAREVATTMGQLGRNVDYVTLKKALARAAPR